MPSPGGTFTLKWAAGFASNGRVGWTRELFFLPQGLKNEALFLAGRPK